MASTIAAVLVTCNEADVIEACLQSVAAWVDEIVVLDMHSTDGTREIARYYSARIIDHDRLPDAGPVRDFALSQATCDWILMLDADERVPYKLAQELCLVAQEDRFDVVEIPRQQILFGVMTHSPGASDGIHPRFFRRGVLSWPPGVHAHPNITHLRCHTLSADRIEWALLHDTWRSVPMVLDKISRYAPRDVEDLKQVGAPFSLRRLVGASSREFFERMFRGRAYEDGMAGLLAAAYFTVYRFTIYATLWEAEGRSRRFDQTIVRWGRRLHWLGMLPLFLERTFRRK